MGKISINIATGSIQKSDTIVGIDLGTTNSLIAIVREDTRQPLALREIDGLSLVPSIVHFTAEGTPVAGTDAAQKLITDPENTIYSVKRLMGKSYNDISAHAAAFSYSIVDDGTDELVRIKVKDTFYSPIDLSAVILKELKHRAEHILKTPIFKAVITVPAYFNDTQRQATRDAGKLAGLDVLRIVNEPTAASLAYGIGIDPAEEKTIAVYDLGGGTFDISILKITNGIFEVLATHGDTYLGGDDMDQALAGFWVSQDTTGILSSGSPSVRQALRLAAEQAKRHLSGSVSFEGDVAGVRVQVTRDQFDQLIQPLADRTIGSCTKALQDAQLTVSEIDAVVMVGGSTRVPLIKKAVQSFFRKDSLEDHLNPDEVVALGAAVQADILAGNNTELLLLDVTPLSLGIETMGGLMDVLIPRNAKIPHKAARQYTTQQDGQGSMRISVYQGERDLVKDNRNLATFNLSGIPGMPAGMAKVEVSFLIDADGILKVSATELRSGVAQSIEVTPKYGLTDTQLEHMLLDSLTHAREDMTARALAEATAEAQQMLDTTERFLQKNRELLRDTECQQTRDQMQVLASAISSGNKDTIRKETEILNDISRPYAERLMDGAIKDAMKGKKII